MEERGTRSECNEVAGKRGREGGTCFSYPTHNAALYSSLERCRTRGDRGREALKRIPFSRLRARSCQLACLLNGYCEIIPSDPATAYHVSCNRSRSLVLSSRIVSAACLSINDLQRPRYKICYAWFIRKAKWQDIKAGLKI